MANKNTCYVTELVDFQAEKTLYREQIMQYLFCDKNCHVNNGLFEVLA